MAGFYGQYSTTLDGKGRFALPAKLRAVGEGSGKSLLSGDLVLAKGLEGCLSLYPQEEWDSIQSRLSSQPFTRRDFRYFSRRFYSSASIVVPDRSGRILVPAHLIAEAGLDKELLLIGVDRTLEIWSPGRFEYYLEQFSGSFEEAAERLLYDGEGKED